MAFGSSKERISTTYITRDISCPFQDKFDSPNLGRYDMNKNSLSRLKPIKNSMGGGVDHHQPILKSEMAKNHKKLKEQNELEDKRLV